MVLWRFRIKSTEVIFDDAGAPWSGCLCLVIAPNVERALQIALDRYPDAEPWMKKVTPDAVSMASEGLVAFALAP